MNAPIKSPVAASPTLEPRPLYGIGTVARLTGLKSDTLRVWERRYGLGASYKSPTGRRQYIGGSATATGASCQTQSHSPRKASRGFYRRRLMSLG